MKNPSEYSINAWTKYLFASIGRETGEKWSPKGYLVALWTRIIKDRLHSGVNPFKLALIIDISALDWEKNKNISPWQLLSPENIHRTLAGYPNFYWRAMWYSRYAEGEKELDYYRYWLIQTAIAVNTESGVSGKTSMVFKCKVKLEDAEEKLKVRRNNKSPTFALHILKAYYGTNNS